MRKLKKLVILLFLLVITFHILPGLLLPSLKSKILNYLNNYFKTETHLENINISLLYRKLVLENFSVKNTVDFGRGNLFEAKKITIYPKILSFIKKEPAVSVTITEPTLSLHRLVSGETNWDFFWSKEQPNKNTKPVILNELLIKNGIFRYSEEHTSNKLAIAEIQGLFIYLKHSKVPITYIENIPLNSKIKGRGYLSTPFDVSKRTSNQRTGLRVRGNLSPRHFATQSPLVQSIELGTEPKGTLHFTGETNLEQNKPSFLLDISMNNIPLIYFNDFYPENSQIEVIQGNFYLESNTRCIEDKLYAKPDVTVKDLRLKLTSNYSTGKAFELPVVLVVDFFDLYKEKLNFSFEIKGTLSDPDFQLRDIVTQKVSQVVSESIIRSIATSPTLATKLGEKIKNIPDTLQKLGVSIGINLKKTGKTAISPAKEFIKGIKGEE